MTEEQDIIRYKSEYTVDVNGEKHTFDARPDAAKFIIEQLRNGTILPKDLTVDDLLNFSGEKDFSGSIGISWEEDDSVPATPFDEILVDYEDRLHGWNGLADMCIDRAHRYIMVEENARGGFYLTTGDSIGELMTSNDGDEYGYEWELVGIYETATGDEVDVEVHTTFEVKSG